jgi:hypothetical protein
LPFSRRFDDILSELQTYQNAVADEVGHAHIIEEADFRALVRTRGGAVERFARGTSIILFRDCFVHGDLTLKP